MLTNGGVSARRWPLFEFGVRWLLWEIFFVAFMSLTKRFQTGLTNINAKIEGTGNLSALIYGPEKSAYFPATCQRVWEYDLAEHVRLATHEHSHVLLPANPNVIASSALLRIEVTSHPTPIAINAVLKTTGIK